MLNISVFQIFFQLMSCLTNECCNNEHGNGETSETSVSFRNYFCFSLLRKHLEAWKIKFLIYYACFTVNSDPINTLEL